jgi:type III pantothenate kinase
MLLAIDVGNSNTVLGLYRAIVLEGEAVPHRYEPEVVAHWRITTPDARTPDEFGMLLRSLFDLGHISITDVTGIAISSVVPPLDSTLRQVCELFFKIRPLFIEPGV